MEGSLGSEQQSVGKNAGTELGPSSECPCAQLARLKRRVMRRRGSGANSTTLPSAVPAARPMERKRAGGLPCESHIGTAGALDRRSSRNGCTCPAPPRPAPPSPARKQPSGVRASAVMGPLPASYRSTGCGSRRGQEARHTHEGWSAGGMPHIAPGGREVAADSHAPLLRHAGIATGALHAGSCSPLRSAGTPAPDGSAAPARLWARTANSP